MHPQWHLIACNHIPTSPCCPPVSFLPCHKDDRLTEGGEKSSGASSSTQTLQHSEEQRKPCLDVRIFTPFSTIYYLTESAFFLLGSDQKMSLLWAWLLKVRFPCHCTGRVSLPYFVKTTAEEPQWGNTVVRGAKGGGQEGEGKEEEKNSKKTSFPLLEGPRTEEITFFSRVLCDEYAIGGLLKFWSVLQKTVLSGRRQSGCFTAVTRLLAIAVDCNQWVPSSPRYYDPNMLSPLWTLLWWIPNSYFPSLRGSVSPLALIRASI